MIRPDEGGLFVKGFLTKFKEVLDIGVLKLMGGSPTASTATLESMQPLAILPITALGLQIANYQMVSTEHPQFVVNSAGKVTWWMIDCRREPTEDQPNLESYGYIRGDVSSLSGSGETAELQLNTLLITLGVGGAFSEIRPVQFSIKVG